MNKNFKIGDIVSRKKYGNDILFKIDKVEGNKVYLVGLDVRLYADASIDDIVYSTIPKKKDSNNILRKLDTNDFFYIPGIILHIDSDENYLDKCMKYYKNHNVKVFGYIFKEKEVSSNILKLIEKHNPNILVITGHDAHYKNKKNLKEYKNSEFFKEAVNLVRKKIKNHNDLIIISGACQSDFNGLILSGSTFASSPKNINIHALDPAIVATYLALSEKNIMVDIEDLLSKTKYGKDGIGGLNVCGMMLKGYPRKE